MLNAFSDPHGPPKNLLDRLRYAFRHPVLIKYHRATYQQMLNHRYAPDGCHTLEIISGLGNDHPFTPWSGTQSRRRGEDYSRLKNRIGMSLVRPAERYIPDLGSNLDFVEFATPLSNEYWVNSVSGGNFGPEQTPAQFGPGRFFDCTAGIEGFFVVGAGAISAGVLSCIASGVWAANQAVEFLEGNIER